MNENQTEKILMEALRLMDEGKSPAEVLGLFPNDRKELAEMFETIKLLELTKKGILPEESFAQNLIKQFPVPSNGVARPARESFWGRLTLWRVLAPAAIFAGLLILALVNSGSQVKTLLAPLQTDRFELASIQREAQTADFNEELTSFLEEENNIEEVDIILTNL